MYLELTFDADFAHVVELRLGHITKAGKVTLEKREGQHRERFNRETWIHFSVTLQVRGKTAFFDFVLEPKRTWKTSVDILPVANNPRKMTTYLQDVAVSPCVPYKRDSLTDLNNSKEKDNSGPLKDVPKLETNYH
jgi:hypothetical protein